MNSNFLGENSTLYASSESEFNKRLPLSVRLALGREYSLPPVMPSNALKQKEFLEEEIAGRIDHDAKAKHDWALFCEGKKRSAICKILESTLRREVEEPSSTLQRFEEVSEESLWFGAKAPQQQQKMDLDEAIEQSVKSVFEEARAFQRQRQASSM
jgi:hypothetical protein